MTDASGIVSGVAGRYATALFELAVESDMIDAVARDVSELEAAVSASPELGAAMASPAISRAEMGAVVASLASRLELSATTANLLGLMAKNRRLGALPKTLAAFSALAAERRGEMTVQVTSAQPLSAIQQETLAQSLSKSAGKTVHMKIDVDPELIGGLVVQMGSKMIDASVRSKLTSLQHAMKEVG